MAVILKRCLPCRDTCTPNYPPAAARSGGRGTCKGDVGAKQDLDVLIECSSLPLANASPTLKALTVLPGNHCEVPWILVQTSHVCAEI